MIPFTVDTRELADEFNLDDEQVNQLLNQTVRNVALRFAKLWDQTAGQNLKSSRNLYRRNMLGESNILVGSDEDLQAWVMLNGTLPNWIENGVGPFDIKKFYAQSRKKKIVYYKDGTVGWYLTIPYRMATPGALGESEIFADVMPQEIYAIAKNLKPHRTTLGGVVQQGDQISIDQIPSPYDIPRTRAQIVTPSKTWEAYENKSSRYEGMRRNEKTYESATQGQYMSFRRASSKSDPNAWIHRGIQARNLAEKALDNLNIPHEVDMSIDNYLAQLGF